MTLIPVLIALALTQAPAHKPAARAATKSGAAKADAVHPATPPTDNALPEQVMLDRAGFSPGVIDGKPGSNTQKAMDLYRREGGRPDAAPVETLTKYTVTTNDASGPYAADIPTDLMEQAKLPALSYRTPLEALSERFHSTPELLQRLNPGLTFAAGDIVTVPNVEPLVLPVERLTTAPPTPLQEKSSATRGPHVAASSQPVAKPDVVVTVSKSLSALSVTDAAGHVIFYAPVTTGSEHDPLPLGEWKVKGVQFNPTFHYNPDLFWDADPSNTKATIPAGPNNPVGLVWIDLSKDHYGIHGTPEPSAIGRTESHGCVRLTNWDALRVAGLVKPGTRVVFRE